MPRVTLFIGGFGDNWFSGIVESYATRYRQANPEITCRYYTWSESVVIRDYLKALPAGTSTSVVGHSWGGDTAFNAVQSVAKVDLLISIDPVAWLKADWTAIRSHCKIWLNVRAEPGAERRDLSDRIASIGTKYDRPPGIGRGGAPDYAYAVNATHGEFYRMMRAAPPGGVNAQMLLGGHSVG